SSRDTVGWLDENTRAVFGRSFADEPDKLVKELAADEAIAAADTLLLTVPNQLGVEYNAHVVESILKFVAPELGWRYSGHGFERSWVAPANSRCPVLDNTIERALPSRLP